MIRIASVLALFAALLMGCTGMSSLITPTAHPTLPTSITPTITPPTPSDKVFTDAIFQRIAVDDTIPASGKQATIRLVSGLPTALFPENSGLVLIYEIPTVPLSQEETTKTAVLLIGTAVSVAKEQVVLLNGVEVIFYVDGQEPFIGFKATAPWSVQDIQVASFSEKLQEKIDEKPRTPTPRPTLPLLGG